MSRLSEAFTLIGQGQPHAPTGDTAALFHHLNVILPRWKEQQKLAETWYGVGIINADAAELQRLRDEGRPTMGYRRSDPVGRKYRRRANSALHRGWEVGAALGPAGITDPFEPIDLS